MKMKVALAASRPTTIKAGGKSAAVIVVECFSHNVVSTTSAPTATPVDKDNCWAAATIAVARLIFAGSLSASAIVLMLVNCSERKKPPDRRTMTMAQNGTPGTNAAQASRNPLEISAL